MVDADNCTELGAVRSWAATQTLQSTPQGTVRTHMSAII